MHIDGRTTKAYGKWVQRKSKKALKRSKRQSKQAKQLADRRLTELFVGAMKQ